VIPYRIALHDTESAYWFIVDLVVDSLFAIDVGINCCLAYFEEEYNELITDHRLIIKRYARTWMTVDVVACIPLHIIVSESTFGYSSLIRVARLPRLYRLIKIAKLARTIR
jgi:hypothetical protein